MRQNRIGLRSWNEFHAAILKINRLKRQPDAEFIIALGRIGKLYR